MQVLPRSRPVPLGTAGVFPPVHQACEGPERRLVRRGAWCVHVQVCCDSCRNASDLPGASGWLLQPRSFSQGPGLGEVGQTVHSPLSSITRGFPGSHRAGEGAVNEKNPQTIYNRNSKEFYLSQTEDDSQEDRFSDNSEKLLCRSMVFSTVLGLVRTKNIKRIRDTFLQV